MWCNPLFHWRFLECIINCGLPLVISIYTLTVELIRFKILIDWMLVTFLTPMTIRHGWIVYAHMQILALGQLQQK